MSELPSPDVGQPPILDPAQIDAILPTGHRAPLRVADPWRRSIALFVLTAVATAFVVVSILAALDPYDTGRFGNSSLWRGRIDGQAVSRGRDPQFDSAIIGSSRMTMIQPEQLDRLTGMHFVSLAVVSSEPIEQLIFLRYFLNPHANVRAIVLGLDDSWCFDPLEPGLDPNFNLWLYDSNDLEYLAHLFSFRAIVDAWQSIHIASYRADGFQDYTAAFQDQGEAMLEAARKMFNETRPTVAFTPERYFPALPRLGEILQTIPASAAGVLAGAPSHIADIPVPGSPAEDAIEACHAAYSQLARSRPRTVAFADWAADRPENRSDENYFNNVHYRAGLAAAFGRDIGAALNTALSDRLTAATGTIQAVIRDMEMRRPNSPLLKEVSSDGATAIASGDDAGSPDRAFDRAPATFWISAERGAAVKDHAWIGARFPEPRGIRRIHIEQSTNHPYRQDLLRVEKSVDGGESWVAAAPAPVRLSAAASEIDLPAGEPARLWRVVAADENAREPRDAWTVQTLVFFADPDEENVPVLAALARNTGAPIASANGFGSPDRAFDHNSATFWISAEHGAAVKDHAWIGARFAEEREIRRLRVEQSTNHPYRQDLVRVEKSVDHGETWVAAAPGPFRLNGPVDWIDLPAGEATRWWRIVAAGDNATTADHAWCVLEINFFAASPALTAVANPPAK